MRAMESLVVVERFPLGNAAFFSRQLERRKPFYVDFLCRHRDRVIETVCAFL